MATSLAQEVFPEYSGFTLLKNQHLNSNSIQGPRAGHRFVSHKNVKTIYFHLIFHCRCISVGKDEEDYRPLFENFLQDLLVTLNRPDWPAAEVLLTLLGRLLVRVPGRELGYGTRITECRKLKYPHSSSSSSLTSRENLYK